MKSSKRDLPENITRTKNGYHVRMVIGGEYHAEYFSDLDYGKRKSKRIALKKARAKRKELAKIRDKYQSENPRPEKYDTRFLYENADNSTGIIGVFYKEELGRNGQMYPYFCTTIVSEKGRPASYARSIKKWGKGEALIQMSCVRKRHMMQTYPGRFDEERFDQSVLNYMKENYLSYTDDAMKRLSECVG